ncbi:MAG: TonB family protein [Pyrinomonadaceae bacterium]
MFNNLIESSSHTREFKRRGSFFLFTTATYILLFVIGGVASIYAYDARLEDQNTETITMLSPVDLAPQKPVAPAANPRPPSGNNNGRSYAVRENPMASVNRPDVPPETTSSTPNTNPPVPDVGPWRKESGNSDPGTGEGPGVPGTGGRGETSGSGAPIIEVGTPPKLEPIQKPVTRLISKKVINSEALYLPKPPYPPLAKQIRMQGAVSVQVLIDETGRVVSAKSISGHPTLTAAAQRAALEARFSPTLIGEQPVKVSGVIIYNFVLQ